MKGQISIFDYLQSIEPVKEPDDSVCVGCKWRTYETRRLEVGPYGHTWVYCCPGTACANWRTGTPLNLSAHDRKPSCYNRDFLPDMEHLLELVGMEYEMEFKPKVWDDGDVQYVHKIGKYKIVLDECTYMGTDKRFVGVDWEGHNEGFSSPCDNLNEVFKAIDKALKRTEEAKAKDKLKSKILPVDIQGICDDAYCPSCGRWFEDSETDAKKCPECGQLVDWTPWHKLND